MTAATSIDNRYEILETLGEGAMGLVWRVKDHTSGKEVALKVISQRYGSSVDGGPPSEKSVLQFQQEFRLMTQLRHPNCCEVYDYGVTPDGAPYFTMEVVEGRGVDELIAEAHSASLVDGQQRGLDGPTFVRVMTKVLLALGYVHQLGYVHCDLKSANVRVRPDGTVKLMDFGLMEYARRPSGFVNGTIAYIAPEVIRRGAIDQRTDLYSLGVLAYEMLAGRVPFDQMDAREVLQGHINDRPTPLSDLLPEVDPQHERIVLKLLEKNPLDRYQSAYEVLEALGAEVPSGIGGNLLTSPMTGRDGEMHVLAEHLDHLKARQPGAALVLCGPSGIGKSRLLEEFRFTVQLASLPCVMGPNFEQGNSPYDPFVAALKGLLPAFRQHVPDELALHAPVLVQLLPELGAISAAAMDSPTKEKLRLQASITDVFTALASRKPFVVVFEDWQWADALSIELMDYMLRNLKRSPVMFLVTSRVAPAEGSLLVPVPLAHLDAPGVTRMVCSMLGTQDVAQRFLDEVIGLSKGSPFFVEKLLEHLVQNQILVNARGRWNTDIQLNTERLPKNLKGLLMWRITCLSEATQEIAHVGAVMGRRFTIDMIKHVARVPDDELFAAVEDLCQNQVFVQGAEGAYSFQQDQIQELLYANIAPPSKRRLHTAVTEAIEDQLGGVPLADAPLEVVTSLAHHALHGEVPEKTIAYALEAGLRASALFANTEAETFLQAGLQLARTHHEPERWRRHRLEYLRCLADVWRLTGKSDRAKEAYVEAIALAEDLGEIALMGRMLTHLGRCHQVLGAFPQALACCERALAICQDGHDVEGAIKAQFQMGRIRLFMGDLARATEHAEAALALARETRDSAKIGEALGILGYFYVASDPDKIAAGVDYLNQSQACLSVMGDWIALNTTLNFLGTAQNMLGDHLDAWRSFQQTKKICYEVGMKDEEVFASLNLAITAYELGEFHEMAKNAAEAQAIARQLNSLYPQGMARTLHAVALAFGGQLTDARRMLADALALARELQHKYMETQVLLYQIQVLLHLGELAEAGAACDALSALIAETGDHEPESRLYLALSEIRGRQGDLDGARTLADKALWVAFGAHAKGMQVRVLTQMASLAVLQRAWPEVRSLTKEALAISTRIGSKYQTGQLYLITGEAALTQGIEGASEAFQTAEAIAAELGSPLLRALALFGQAASQPDSGHAHVLAAEARDLLDDLSAGLSASAREAFFGHRERRRVLEGDYQAFGKPLDADASRSATGSVPQLGLNQGLWKML